MNRHTPLHLLDPRHGAAIQAVARDRAVQLRAEAHREFWGGIGRALRRAWIALRMQRPPHAHC